MSEKAILSTAYLGPIQYYSKILKYNQVFIEVNENFIKQTYRNRCKIYGANGELSLSIPVKKTDIKTKIKDLLIDYDTNWRKLHWKSIESAYRSSPFFEFYADDFLPFYNKKYKFLLDFNTEIQSMILDHLEIEFEMNFTKEYISYDKIDFPDFREKINPKMNIPDSEFEAIEYTQVFAEKYGFIPNLSIIDLLFNEGPNAIGILNLSYK